MLDLYGKLIEKMDGAAAKQRFGGDAGKRDTQSMPRKVLLVDLFSGPVVLDAKGEATGLLKLPDFNGTLRLMAVVSSADSYGSTAGRDRRSPRRWWPSWRCPASSPPATRRRSRST